MTDLSPDPAAPGAPPTQPPEQPQREMEALRLSPAEGPAPRLEHSVIARPRLRSADDVLIEIRSAGLCRTDLYVASGELPARPGVVLGHEGAGLVVEVGAAVQSVGPGDLVGLDPRVPCGRCDGCASTAGACLRPDRLGVERDGVFAGYVALPAANVLRLEPSIGFSRAAYLEPVAAAMGVLHAGLSQGDRGVIVGAGRIAELTQRVMVYAGFTLPDVVPPHALGGARFDFVVDAGLPDDAALASMVHALRPGGTLVLKSRSADARSFLPSDWVAREITVAARAYGSFEKAADALADPRLELEDLFGSTRPLTEFAQVFHEAQASEAKKLFLAPG